MLLLLRLILFCAIYPNTLTRDSSFRLFHQGKLSWKINSRLTDRSYQLQEAILLILPPLSSCRVPISLKLILIAVA